MSNRHLILDVELYKKGSFGITFTETIAIKNGINLSSTEIGKVLDERYNEDGELWLDFTPI